MTEATKILDLINNNGDADEINARTWCLFNGVEYIGTVNNNHMYRGRDHEGLERGFKVGDYPQDHPIAPNYYNSLDAQLALMDEHLKGWDVTSEVYYATNKQPEGKEYVGHASKPDFLPEKYHPYDSSEWITRIDTGKQKLPTEQAARLNAIIKAYAYQEGL